MATPRQIELFLQLAVNLHFGRTAQKLGISQAALSREVNNLERNLNIRLLDRSNKWNVVLTEAGKAYYQQIKNLPNIYERAEKIAKRAYRGETGTLNIAVANMIYDYLPLGELFRRMHEKFPEIKLIIRDFMGSPMVTEQITNGDADIGFIALSNHGSPVFELRQSKIMELDVSLAINNKHPLAHKQDLQIKDLINCNFIMPPAQYVPWLRGYFEKIFKDQCGVPLNIYQEALGLRATRQLVSAGLGIALVIQPHKPDERENIVYRKLPIELKRVISAAWDENNSSPVLKNMLALLPEFIKNHSS